jgi:hypothetical protein
VTDFTRPREAESVVLPGSVGLGTHVDGVLYFTGESRGSTEVEVGLWQIQPPSPEPEPRFIELGTHGTRTRSARLLETHGRFLFAVSSSALWVVDAADPASPREVGFVDLEWESWPSALLADGRNLLLVARDGMRVFDISAPPNPRELSEEPLLSAYLDYGDDAALERGRLYLAHGLRLSIWDVTDPLRPTLICTRERRAHDVAAMGGLVAVACFDEGMTLLGWR